VIDDSVRQIGSTGRAPESILGLDPLDEQFPGAVVARASSAEGDGVLAARKKEAR
jgi:hypothetical protein